MTWNNVQPPCNTCMHCAQSSQYHGNHLGSTFHMRLTCTRRSPYLANFSACSVIRLHKPIRLMPIPPALHWNLKMPTNVPVDDGGDLIVSISVVRRCHCTTACHNVVDCFQACTAHAASGTDISMQDVVLVVPSPKSLVLSSHHQSLSRTRKVRSLQPTKGLFGINRRLLSETAILTMHRFPAP